MQNPWIFLSMMFWIRATLAFQYQAVGALSGQTMTSTGLDLADIGILIGVYSIPGIFMAIPGAKFGRMLGNKTAIILGQLLMLAGGLAITLSHGFEFQLLGRLMAGCGAIILNVLMTAMVTERCKGRYLSTALAIFVNSWPVGIAAALFILPFLAERFGLSAANGFVCMLIILNIVLFSWQYRNPSGYRPVNQSGLNLLEKTPLIPMFIAALIWGLYNSALAMIFSFTPAILGEFEFSAEHAGVVTSMIMLAVTLAVPLGGMLSDRLFSPFYLLVPGLFLFSLLLAVTPNIVSIPLFLLLGFAGGLLAGPIISLPAHIKPDSNDTPDMGLYFTIYYLLIVTTPIIAGAISDWFHSAQTAHYLGSIMLMTCLPLFYWFLQTVRRLRASPTTKLQATPQVPGLQVS